MNKTSHRLIAGVLLLLSIALPLAGCSKSSNSSSANKPGGAAGQPAPVTVAVAVESNVPVQLQAVGHVVAFSFVAVRSRVDGTLDKVHFKEGDLVRQGDLIFTIDPRPFEAALNQAKANREKDVALQRNAELDARRNQTLLTNGIVSQEIYDQSRASADSLQATIVADQAAVETAELQLSYCYIHSPIDGRMSTLQVNAGNVVKVSDTILATINQTQPIYVDFSVPEQQLPRVRRFASAHGELDVESSVPGVTPPSRGALSVINNTVDTDTGTILLRAIFPNTDEVLWPGQFANVILTLTTLTNAVVVPAQAVQAGQQGQNIFVVKPDNTVDVRSVTVENRVGEQIVVVQGVKPGEHVVTVGQLRLAPGIKVQIQNPPAPANVSASPDPGNRVVKVRY